MSGEAFAWAPFIAIGCGMAAGLAIPRSVKRVVILGVVAMLIQVIAWMAIFMAARAFQHEPGDWNPDFWASFMLSLIVVIPYTVIGAVVMATVIGLLGPRARREQGPPFWPRRHTSGTGHS